MHPKNVEPFKLQRARTIERLEGGSFAAFFQTTSGIQTSSSPKVYHPRQKSGTLKPPEEERQSEAVVGQEPGLSLFHQLSLPSADKCKSARSMLVTSVPVLVK